MKLIRRNSLAANILKGIGLTGAVLLSMSSPYFGLNLLKGIKRNNSKKEWAKFYASLRYLDRRGHAKIIKRGDDGIHVAITQKGRKMLYLVDIDNIKLTDKTIDGKWRLIIFDVPNEKSKNRIAFTEKLKELGFIMIQKSVWVTPYPCHKEIMILRKFYEIEPYVTYLEGVNIEDELSWRGAFNKKNR